MVHIVVDLEMNWLDFKYENERKISTNEVIEIGAVTMNEKFEEIGAFKMYVKPQFNEKNIPWKEDVDKVFRQWHDFQKEFSDLVGIGRIITLSQAVDYAGIDFAGQKHDACCDARNTAYLLALTKDEKRFAKTMKSVLEAFNHEELTSSIGSLIDFSAWNGVGA